MIKKIEDKNKYMVLEFFVSTLSIFAFEWWINWLFISQASNGWLQLIFLPSPSHFIIWSSEYEKTFLATR